MPKAPKSAEPHSHPKKPVRVAFILQENFSMMAFTAALDALVTANLVRAQPIFEYFTLGVDSRMVTSDLGLDLATDGALDTLTIEHRDNFDILVICGGLRCALTPNPLMNTYLKAADRLGITLAGLWNGAIPMLHAGLLDGTQFAVHPDNHAYVRELFPEAELSERSLEFASQRATCAGPNSALELMLKLVGDHYDPNTVRAIREILSCDQSSENRDARPLSSLDTSNLPESLGDVIALMRANIEEPLSTDDLAQCSQISRRQMERLFQLHLDKSPSRYYLELRLNHARRLLLQTQRSITDIAIASGFVSSSHFSNCYKDFFGLSPSATRQRPTASA